MAKLSFLTNVLTNLKILAFFKIYYPESVLTLFTLQTVTAVLIYFSSPPASGIIRELSPRLWTSTTGVFFMFASIVYVIFYVKLHGSINRSRVLSIFFQYYFPIFLIIVTLMVSNILFGWFLGFSVGLVISSLITFVVLALLKNKNLLRDSSLVLMFVLVISLTIFFLGVNFLAEAYSTTPLPSQLFVKEGITDESYKLKCSPFANQHIANGLFNCNLLHSKVANGTVSFWYANGSNFNYKFNQSISFIAPENIASIRFDITAVNQSEKIIRLSTNNKESESWPVYFPTITEYKYRKEKLATLFFALIFLIIITVPKFVFEIKDKIANNK